MNMWVSSRYDHTLSFRNASMYPSPHSNDAFIIILPVLHLLYDVKEEREKNPVVTSSAFSGSYA